MSDRKSIKPQKQKAGEGLFASSTFFFSAIANKQTHATSSIFRRQFGLGISEWRCLAAIKTQGSVSAVTIAALGGMSKSLVSKALARLQGLHHIQPCAGSQKPLLLELTVSGEMLFNAMFKVAKEAEEQSIRGISESDQKKLLNLLKVVYENIERLEKGS